MISMMTKKGDKLMSNMPKFLNLGPEVTGDPAFSMYNLSLKEDWEDNKKFCHKMYEENENNDDFEHIQSETREAQNRLKSKKSVI